ncbi:HAD family phosphatase [Kribbella pittospori]|uniref:HAD family phosphatase n=1 Tax=Kribbella pittospori TaxID=722689 RepID=A0A4V2M7Q7_9ACTN|nr:HAD family hydrolase [Kribbella pittospori]TCC48542.1 HAD family phosphatase [Kribbella pittospori]
MFTWLPELAAAAEHVAGRLGLHGLGPFELGILSQREWADQLTACLPMTPRVDLRHWGEHWYADQPVNEALLDQLRAIADHGVPVGLLTNSVAEWEPHRARVLAGQEIFSATVKSHEIRLAKPDPAIFRYADNLLPPPAGQHALLIDDNRVNCAAAEHHGWLTIHHRSTPDTIAQLGRMRLPM